MELRIISTNIRFDNPHDGIHQWENRKKILSQVLKNFSPDVIGTQEGRQPQLQGLSELLPDYLIMDAHRSWIPERMYPTIFINKKTVTPLASGDIWLSETPHIPGSLSFKSMFPRLATWLKGHVKEKGHFLYINLHLDHVLAETRQEQIRVLIEQIPSLNPENFPLILGGDFNEGPHEKVRQYIEQHLTQLFDPWANLQRTEQSSYHKFLGNFEEGSRIDWILLDKAFRPEEIYFDTSSEQGLYPSDHFPLKLRCLFESSGHSFT